MYPASASFCFSSKDLMVGDQITGCILDDISCELTFIERQQRGNHSRTFLYPALNFFWLKMNSFLDPALNFFSLKMNSQLITAKDELIERKSKTMICDHVREMI
jgi:hypothetical protein